ncbi:MAG: hypothetical protein DSO07_12910 [Thermoproteota archaeon]|jgi:hypothetical protein|uniref:Uncharacterized protein n=1 Tax=Candidatus Methanodesulfokora washburnensis TaxID=2478471 RepID=A0A3R9QFY0_9CREN|nr:hypothetical protein [Candidatus Methanodesulfokores washburnensis]RSN75573.1 hypothetical protein D6D85_05905 [Candidatus Methanodesulfokores washburnensis]TDA37134.1 MAG: hypothetical protein DSO07_12910 [Candidatus Korarchaeota archaeon]
MSELGDFISELLKTCDFLEDHQALALEIEIRGPECLDRCLTRLNSLLDDPRIKQIPINQRSSYERRIKERIKLAMEWKRRLENPQVSLTLFPGKISSFEGEEVELRVELINENPIPLDVTELKPSDNADAVDFQSLPPLPLQIVPFGQLSWPLRIKLLKSGTFELSLLATIKALEKQLRLSEKVILEVNPYTAELKVVSEAPSEIKAGEEIPVVVKLENEGTSRLSVTITNPFDEKKREKLELLPGDRKDVVFSSTLAPGSYKIAIPPVEYTDERGVSHQIVLKELSVNVIEQVQSLEKEKGGEKPGEELPIDIESLLSGIAKHMIAAWIGKIIGEKHPEVREYPKPVLVQNVPFEKLEDKTVILEDPSGVMIEDKGDYVLVRRPRRSEILHYISMTAARELMGDFRLQVRSALSSWRPCGDRAKPSIREKNLSKDAIKRILDIARKKNPNITPKMLDEELPKNFVVRCEYREGRIFRRVRLKVYAGAYARLENLYFNGVDYAPLTLREAVESLGLSKVASEKADYDIILLLASPNGWDPSSIETAKKHMGRLSVILINLKTGEAYYNEENSLVSQLADKLGFISEPVLLNEAIKRLDMLLLRGDIDSDTYLREISKITKLHTKSS